MYPRCARALGVSSIPPFFLAPSPLQRVTVQPLPNVGSSLRRGGGDIEIVSKIQRRYTRIERSEKIWSQVSGVIRNWKYPFKFSFRDGKACSAFRAPCQTVKGINAKCFVPLLHAPRPFEFSSIWLALERIKSKDTWEILLRFHRTYSISRLGFESFCKCDKFKFV